MEAALKLDLTPECEEVGQQALTIPEQARAIKITDVATYTGAGDLWKSIKALRSKVAETFNPLIDNAHRLHKSILAKKQAVDGPLEEAEKTVKRAMEAFDREQERLRREAEEKLREQARKEEEERRLQEAIILESEGQTAIAEAVMEAPVYVAPVVIPKTTPKMAGGPVFREVWDFEIIDEKAIPREYMVPDLVKIRKVVTALKNQSNIAGVRAYSKRV